MTVNSDLAGHLIGALRHATGRPDLAYKNEPEPVEGGFWADILSFSLANPPDGWPTDLIARLMPDPAAARKETIVQAAVAAAGFPTPLVRASGGPDHGLDRAFMVMDKAAGGALLSGLDGVLTSGAARRAVRLVPGLLAGSMARLHALDPDIVRGELGHVGDDVPVTVIGLVRALQAAAGEFGRPDLVSAARWLTDHPPAPAPDVICHGDLHPFNLLAEGGRVTVLDWSTALLAPRAYDVAFTSLLLSEPPLRVPGWQRPAVHVLGWVLARQFVRGYQRQTGARIAAGELEWHQAVICLRALIEVASWVREYAPDGAHGSLADQRAAHPWLAARPVFARRLGAMTGIPVEAELPGSARLAPSPDLHMPGTWPAWRTALLMRTGFRRDREGAPASRTWWPAPGRGVTGAGQPDGRALASQRSGWLRHGLTR